MRVVRTDLVERLYALRTAAVFAADAELGVWLGLPAQIAGHRHELAHAGPVERLAGVLLQGALFEVAGEEPALGAIAVGASPIFVRLSELGPSATAFWRLALALPAPLLWPEVAGRRERTARRPSGYGDHFAPVLAGLFFTGDIAPRGSSG